MVKLSRLGLRRKLWSLIRDSYKYYQCAALIAGQPGTWFVPEWGIHQGAPLSMPLYQVYINDLLTQLRDNDWGNIRHMSCNCRQIAICALCKHVLNELLQIAYDFSKKWFFEFRREKCLVMVWGRDRDPDMNVRRNGWRDINISMSDAMARHVETLPVENRLEFISSGLGSNYINEWKLIYCNIDTFVTNIYWKV